MLDGYLIERFTRAMTASESAVQSAVRLEYARRGYTLYRHNTGSLPNPDTGRYVRFGLGNDSEQTNRLYKFGDLVGWRRVLITPEMVGSCVAVFANLECKPGDWRPARSGGPNSNYAREQAQLNAIRLVRQDGGIGAFMNGLEPYADL